ncbi:S-adenosylmethionine synthetase [Elusimicrobium simillimum]|uniref:methionine adenosyltransferase n=1 Tax=Elusimicrobium simillimum TaxID=3143438 RepID=UPI003C6EADEC
MIKKGKCLFTSESVGEGHPDKMCDAISDAILDAILAKDKNARVACETYVTRGLVVVGGEITTNTWVDTDAIAREEIKTIGYIDAKYGFNHETCAILNVIGKQSPDISQGVDHGGAGDQGLMVGYAVNETKELMPITLVLSNKIVKALAVARRGGKLPFIGPDCKSQITFEYVDGKPVRIDTVVVSTQHTVDVLDKTGKHMTEAAKKKIIDVVVMPIIKKWADKNTKIYINPTGKFVIGGPQSDTGMTGRKIIVDTYGGRCPHGGGAFSGKDPTKVDRSAAYMARYIAKNIVAAGLAHECTVQVAYAIGRAEPVGFYVDTHETGKIDEGRLTAIAKKVFPLTPKGIIEHFKLRRPIYKATAAYGHFGREQFPWEKTDKAAALKKAAGI